jgi:hypothetical protein
MSSATGVWYSPVRSWRTRPRTRPRGSKQKQTRKSASARQRSRIRVGPAVVRTSPVAAGIMRMATSAWEVPAGTGKATNTVE